MTEQWRELKETITEMRDNDGTGTQQEVCKFLANLMDVLEKQMSNQNKGDLISRRAVFNIIEKEQFKGDAIAEIEKLPSVENKGEWIKIQSGDKDFPESIVCSKCKNENSHLDFNEHAEPIGKVFVTSNFCPNCGADMRGE